MIKTFAHHTPSPESLTIIRVLREAYSKLYEHIVLACSSSRERSLALTELEESAMWAIKSVILNDPKSLVEIDPKPEMSLQAEIILNGRVKTVPSYHITYQDILKLVREDNPNAGDELSVTFHQKGDNNGGILSPSNMVYWSHGLIFNAYNTGSA